LKLLPVSKTLFPLLIRFGISSTFGRANWRFYRLTLQSFSLSLQLRATPPPLLCFPQPPVPRHEEGVLVFLLFPFLGSRTFFCSENGKRPWTPYYITKLPKGLSFFAQEWFLFVDPSLASLLSKASCDAFDPSFSPFHQERFEVRFPVDRPPGQTTSMLMGFLLLFLYPRT